jgi:methyl-accepting chemotaxis protein
MDANGEFTDQVQQIQVASQDLEADAEKIRQYVEMATNASNSQAALENKVVALNSLLADEAIEAEKARVEMVNFADKIEKQKDALDHAKRESSKITWFMGALTVLLNVFAIIVLAKLIVERPLSKLSTTIADIRNGGAPAIPYQGRKDQIGTLSVVLKEFSEMVDVMRMEDERKITEQALVKDVLKNLSATIETEMKAAKSLETASSNLLQSVAVTEEHSLSVKKASSNTEQNTNAVSESVQSMKTTAGQISQQANEQRDMVREISNANQESKQSLEKLFGSVNEIKTIVGMVKEIADQTKLLALNATIESARAGSAGKGFAVVANEVKALSNQTEQAVSDISSKIDTIAKDNLQVTHSIEGINHSIVGLSELADSIYDTVQQQEQATQLIEQTTAVTTADMQSVAGGIAKVFQAATRTQRLSDSVCDFSKHLAEALDRLMRYTAGKLGGIADRN